MRAFGQDITQESMNTDPEDFPKILHAFCHNAHEGGFDGDYTDTVLVTGYQNN